LHRLMPTVMAPGHVRWAALPLASACRTWLFFLCSLLGSVLYLVACVVICSISLLFVLIFAAILEQSMASWEWGIVCGATVMIFITLLVIAHALNPMPDGGTAVSLAARPLKPGVVDLEAVCPERPCVEVDICVVCLDALQPGEASRQLPCGHIFHSGCVDLWAGQQPMQVPRCPICRRVVAFSS